MLPLAAAVAAVAAAALPAAAVAAGGGLDNGGGVLNPQRAKITSVRCFTDAGVGCDNEATVERSGLIRIRGKGFQRGQQVLFMGRRGSADDVAVPSTPQTTKRIDQKVPTNARSGKIAIIATDGVRSRASKTAITIVAPALTQPERVPGGGSPPPVDGPGIPRIAQAGATPAQVFYAGRRQAAFTYVVADDSVRVQASVVLTRLSDKKVVKTWEPSWVPTGQPVRVVWDGSVRGRPQRPGRYRFELNVRDRGGRATKFVRPRKASAAQPSSDVDLFHYIFPIRGPHQYGLGAGRFGAGRGGYRHQGQDTFAKCGTPLVAARGGTVKWRAFQSRAGNYLIIDGKGTGEDHGYMHLRHPALVKKGQRVYTGQQIGEVGQTGDAQGCHLHFEIWTAPGWYDGGHPRDPLPSLRAWDSWS